MALNTINPTSTAAWKKLEVHFNEMQKVSMKELFQLDNSRANTLHVQWNDFLIDYSKNIITQETIELLTELATEMGLHNAIKDYFDGAIINQTENRAVLHTALRAKESAVVTVDGINIIPEIYEVKRKMQEFTNQVTSGEKKGYSGKAFTDIVNIRWYQI
jgi:glucose-6-phosphate isomerase